MNGDNLVKTWVPLLRTDYSTIWEHWLNPSTEFQISMPLLFFQGQRRLLASAQEKLPTGEETGTFHLTKESNQQILPPQHLQC